MSDSKGPFIPRDPQNVFFGPLDKGMDRENPPHRLEKGSVLTAKNLIPSPNGLKRRWAHRQYSTNALDYPPGRGIDLFWTTGGTNKPFVFDSKFLYEFNPSTGAFTGKYWVYDSGDVDVTTGDATVTGNTTAWNTDSNMVRAGDVIVLDPGGANEQEAIIDSITDDTHLEMDADADHTAAGESYEIRRAFGATNPYLLNWTVFGNQVVIADYTRPPYKYDGTTFTEFDSGVDYVPSCVAFWQDRLWLGRIKDDYAPTSYNLQRIRWSNAGSGNWTTFDAGDYQDLPYTRGGLQRLLPLSEELMIYMSDGIYRAYPSERNDVPMLIDKIETGGVGLVGMQAICSHFDAHFFVGQDNIYMIDSRGRRPIGTKVVQKTIRECQNLWAIYATPMTKLDSVAFAFPESGTTFAKVWTFNYKSGAWGYHDLAGDSTFAVAVPNETVWDDAVGTWDAFDGSWDALGAEFPVEEDFYTFTGDYLYWMREQAQDTGGTNVPIEFVTPDHDFGLPDQKKTAYRFGMKLEDVVSGDKEFAVTGSTDRGETWKSLGTLTISDGKDEGYVSFRLTGSLLRFKVTGSPNMTPFTINEYTMRIKQRGKQIGRI